MDSVSRDDRIGTAIRKKRTQASRRPKPDYSPLSDDIGNPSSDDENGMNPRRKEVNVNQFVNRVYSGSKSEASRIRVNNNEGEFKEFYINEPVRGSFSNRRSSEGVLAPANWKSSKTVELMNGDLKNDNFYSGKNSDTYGLEQSRMSDASGSENKVKKVKLKVGGVTRTIQANPTTNGAASLKATYMPDSSMNNQRPDTKVYLEESQFTYSKRPGLQGIPWKDFSSGGYSLGVKDSLGTPTKNSSIKQGNKSEPARKSKRVSKRRSLDGGFGEDYEDDEIRYLEKLKGPKLATEGIKDDDLQSRNKQRKIASVARAGALKLKDGKKTSTEDVDYEEDEELASDTDAESVKGKKQKKDVDSLLDGGRGIALTTRQRALQSSKDGSSASGGNLVEFPEGLPPAPPRKQKEKLTEMEQQLKKAEAAERRRMQNEKAARESEAEAIRKILGQDSGRKKREDKIKKRQEVLAQEKAANSLTVASNTVRWVMGPTGTVVTFPSDVGLPSLFNSKPSSYPPLRETCAGPSCTNPYKYRDSKSKLPLCSLQCYKAVQVHAPAGTTC